jgi:hypothetical protein
VAVLVVVVVVVSQPLPVVVVVVVVSQPLLALLIPNRNAVDNNSITNNERLFNTLRHLGCSTGLLALV